MLSSRPRAVRRALLVVAVCTIAGLSWAGTGAASLTLDRRAVYQARLEALAHADRAGAATAVAMTPAQIRAKAAAALDKSAALARLWHAPITPAMLQAELDRITAHTKDPQRLRAIFAALDNDPAVVAECLARPLLADRLLRSAYAGDATLHGAVRARAEAGLASLRAGSGSIATTRLNWTRDDDGSCRVDDTPDRVCVDPADFDRRLAEMPADGAWSSLRESEAGFATRRVVSRHDASAVVEIAAWPKQTFDAWWSGARQALGRVSDRDAASAPAAPFFLPQVPDAGCTPDTWDVSMAPESRDWHTAIWTGHEVIFWGGVASEYRNDGQRYDPVTDTWAPMSAGPNEPSARHQHTAVWTGQEMIVWGGSGAFGPVGTGARYNPATDVWIRLDDAGAPSARYAHAAVWDAATAEMIVWGGLGPGTALANGARYAPATDTWRPISSIGAPSARGRHTAVLTGARKMIVWGGTIDADGSVVLASGAVYDAAADSWAPVSYVNAPSARDSHTALWTGTEMIVWGGRTGSLTLANGGRYEPVSDTWTAVPASGAPSGRFRHSAVWTGTEMIVWGGYGSGPWLGDGARFDPAANTWAALSALGAPSPRERHTATWTGSQMVVWGGKGSGGWLGSGARYTPATDSWVPTSLGVAVPAAREAHTALRLGTGEMMIWGGRDFGGYVNTGSRYSPATDTWVPTSLGPNTPTARMDHAMVLTSSGEVFLWGGFGSLGVRGDGAMYNPATDTWRAIGAGSAPSSRYGHTAVATNDGRVIVWGGAGAGAGTATGGVYTVATDTWVPTTLAGAPVGRYRHRALWLRGGSMFVWGGSTGASVLQSGAMYDLASAAWSPVTTSGAPSPRQDHTMVEINTGEVVVWGGSGFTGAVDTGGRYQPATDTWTPVGQGPFHPSARFKHSVIYTGVSEMIIWGGYGENAQTNSGARYRPADDSWSPTGVGPGIPYARYAHTAVLSSDERMIIWGGLPYGTTTSIYCSQPCTPVSWYEDRDRDGFGNAGNSLVSCDQPSGYVTTPGDCRDLDVNTYPGAPEISGDSIDENCDGTEMCFTDADGDHYGTPALVASTADTDCNDAGEAATPSDCDDALAGVNPGAAEVVADGIDQNCSGGDACYVDADADGFGTSSVIEGNDLDCAGTGEASVAGDCDDQRDAVFPGGIETADCADEDCDGLTDEGLLASIAALDPSRAAKDHAVASLTLDGAQFACDAEVEWTDVDGATTETLPAVRVNGTRFVFTVPSRLVDQVGTAHVRVVNPGGTASSLADFLVRPGIELPDAAAGGPGADTVVPLRVNPADGATSIAATFSYDPARFEARAVYGTAFGSTLTTSADLSSPGTVVLAQMAPAALSGSGETAWVVLRTKAGATGTVPLVFGPASLDGGAIDAIAVDGTLAVTAATARLALADDATAAPPRPAPPQSPANTVGVPLHLTGAAGLSTLHLRVRSNPLVALPTGAAPAAFASGWTVTATFPAPGVAEFDFAGPALTGDGTLATITFSATGADGTATPLDLETAVADGGASAIGLDDGLLVLCADGDDDGVTVCGGDCDDTRATVSPRLVEARCDGLDDDCDGATLDAPDGDGDGFDVCGAGDLADPDGRTVDCDDALASVFPGALETCDGRDDDCDGASDENPEAGTASCADASSTACRLDLCGSVAGAPVCSYEASGACGVGGTLRYYLADLDGNPATIDPVELGDAPLPGFAVDLAASPSGAALSTTADGSYASGPVFGSVSVAPAPRWGSPRADESGSISGQDASIVARHSAGLEPLSNLRKLAADVTGNQSVSALDASLIAQYSVGLVDHFPVATTRGSDWAFVQCAGGVAANCPAWTPWPGPASQGWSPLAQGETADFYGVLYGEVSGNWPTRQFALTGRRGAARADVAVATGDADPVRVEAGAGATSTVKLVPMTTPRPFPATLFVAEGPVAREGGAWRAVIGIAHADGIQAFDLALAADPALVTDLSIAPAGLAANYTLVLNDTQRTAGRIAAALYGTEPMHGSGLLLEITFRAAGPVLGLPLRLDVQANEGLVPIAWPH